jgi:hypothetical protein
MNARSSEHDNQQPPDNREDKDQNDISLTTDLEATGSSRTPSDDAAADVDGQPTASINSSGISDMLRNRKLLVTFLIVLVGAGASAAFLSYGIVEKKEDERADFERVAAGVANSIESAFSDY